MRKTYFGSVALDKTTGKKKVLIFILTKNELPNLPNTY